jgi:hypothetical protein
MATLVFALLTAATNVASAQTRVSHARLGSKTPAEAPVITLERAQCKGQCPEYKLSFFSDGTVLYDGKANVSKAGRWRATLPRQTLDYFSLDNTFGGGLSHNPIAITSWRRNDKVKTVTHDVGSPFSPPALTTLEEAIDNAVQSASWVR